MTAHPLRTSSVLALAALVGCTDAASTDPAEQDPETGVAESARSHGVLYQRRTEAGTPEIAVGFPGGRVVPVRAVSGSLMPGSGPGPGQMAVSPDGKRMVFVSFEGGENRLIARPIRGTAADEVILARDVTSSVKAAWSPDGSQIAYVGRSRTSDSESDTVLLVPAAGGKARTIASVSTIAAGGCLAPSWSPDGKELAFALSFKLSTYRLRDGKTTDIVPDGDAILCGAQWSPDGKTIAYDAFFGSQPGVHRVARAGGAVTLVAADGSSARWSADSAQLAYLTFGEHDLLHVIRADGRDDRVLADSPVRLTGPQFVAGGNTILLEQIDDSAGTERLLTASTRGGAPADLGIEDAIPGMTYPVALPPGAASLDDAATGSVTWPPGPGATAQPGE